MEMDHATGAVGNCQTANGSELKDVVGEVGIATEMNLVAVDGMAGDLKGKRQRRDAEAAAVELAMFDEILDGVLQVQIGPADREVVEVAQRASVVDWVAWMHDS